MSTQKESGQPRNWCGVVVPDGQSSAVSDDCRILTFDQVCRRVDASKGTIRAAVVMARFPVPLVIDGGRAYWLASVIEEWMATHGHEDRARCLQKAVIDYNAQGRLASILPANTVWAPGKPTSITGEPVTIA